MGWGAVVRKAGCGVRDGDHQVAAGRFVENESDKDLWAPHATHLYERGERWKLSVVREQIWHTEY